MSELSREARALIDAGRARGPELLGPSPAQRARLRERLGPLWDAEPPRPPLPRWRRWLLASSVALVVGLGSWLRAAGPLGPAARDGASPLAAATSQAPDGPAARERAHASPLGAREGTSSADRPAEAPPPETLPHTGPAEIAPGVVTHGNGVTHAPAATPLSAARTARKREPAPASARPGRSTAAVSGMSPGGQTCSKPGGCAPAEPRADDAAACAQADACAGSAVRPGAETAPLTAAAAERSRAAIDTQSRPGPRSIEGELELLADAQTALQAQRPSQALRLLQEHAFRFPAGALADERLAIQALALCAQGRKQAAASVLSSLAARGSGSALLPRVRRQCGL